MSQSEDNMPLQRVGVGPRIILEAPPLRQLLARRGRHHWIGNAIAARSATNSQTVFAGQHKPSRPGTCNVNNTVNRRRCFADRSDFLRLDGRI